MCVPYASDNAGAPVGGLGGLAGTNADLFKTIGGTAAPSLAGITGSGGTLKGSIPTAGSTVLSSGSANTGLPPVETAAIPNVEPVAGVPAPAPVATAPARPPGWGVDPLPQTSGHTDIVSRTGHDSLSPLADAIIARRGGGAPSAPPLPPTRPGETAALPGTVPASAPPAASAATLAPGALPDVAVVESYIRKRASELGVDPNVAVAVAKSEGLSPGVWQSNVAGGGGPGNREPSWGPFQLHDKYMGADFTRQTGLRASDPNTWQQQVDFVLGNVSRTGWTPFHGAANTGIGARQGLPGVSDTSPSGGYAANGAPLIAFGSSGSDTLAGGDGYDKLTSEMDRRYNTPINNAHTPETTGNVRYTPPAPGDDIIRGDSGTDTLRGDTRTRSIEYANRHKTRNKPLDPELESNLDRATAPEGVTTRVVSGGQPSSGGPDVRTGSHRHDELKPGSGGRAGDVQFIKDGRILDMTNAADLEIIKRIMGRLWGSGVRGLGGSPNYMGSQIFHVGYGTPAVWGAGGQGKNAPAWLQEIARSGGIPMPGGTAVASGGTAAPSAAAAATSDGGILGRLAGLGSGGGGGRVPASGMDARIEEFLTADALRRKKLRESLPAFGELSLQPQHMQGREWDVASLASILGTS